MGAQLIAKNARGFFAGSSGPLIVYKRNVATAFDSKARATWRKEKQPVRILGSAHMAYGGRLLDPATGHAIPTLGVDNLVGFVDNDLLFRVHQGQASGVVEKLNNDLDSEWSTSAISGKPKVLDATKQVVMVSTSTISLTLFEPKKGLVSAEVTLDTPFEKAWLSGEQIGLHNKDGVSFLSATKHQPVSLIKGSFQRVLPFSRGLIAFRKKQAEVFFGRRQKPTRTISLAGTTASSALVAGKKDSLLFLIGGKKKSRHLVIHPLGTGTTRVSSLLRPRKIGRWKDQLVVLTRAGNLFTLDPEKLYRVANTKTD